MRYITALNRVSEQISFCSSPAMRRLDTTDLRLSGALGIKVLHRATLNAAGNQRLTPLSTNPLS
jgi:hypothetical protein